VRRWQRTQPIPNKEAAAPSSAASGEYTAHRHNGCRSGYRHDRLADVFEQDLDVLDGRNQPVLNLHPPQPSPAGAFESMVVGRVRKADLREVLPALAIPSRRRAVSLPARLIEQFLVFVAVNRASVGSAGRRGQTLIIDILSGVKV
jgi:hypothetical protein